jgi:hypothetical protein
MNIESFIIKLRKQGYGFAWLLKELAQYSKQRDDWSLVTHYLLLAAAEVERRRGELCDKD